MREETVFIPVTSSEGTLLLEGRLGVGNGERRAGVVLCHPHPLYGGDMDNPVIVALQEAFALLGMHTLRFQFRGVGMSEGRHDHGRGEVDDVKAAFAFFHARHIRPVYGGGYSFGSWVLLRALSDLCARFPLAGLVLVSPPVDFMDFSKISSPRTTPSLFIAGSRDVFCSLPTLERWLSSPPSPLHTLSVIEGEDHFFWTGLPSLRQRVVEEVRRWESVRLTTV